MKTLKKPLVVIRRNRKIWEARILVGREDRELNLTHSQFSLKTFVKFLSCLGRRLSGWAEILCKAEWVFCQAVVRKKHRLGVSTYKEKDPGQTIRLSVGIPGESNQTSDRGNLARISTQTQFSLASKWIKVIKPLFCLPSWERQDHQESVIFYQSVWHSIKKITVHINKSKGKSTQ